MKRAVGILAALALLLVAPATAAPADDGWRLDLGAGASALVFDEELANYRWDVQPTAALQLHASALRSRWALGLNVQTTSTVQQSGIPGETIAPQVALHSLELHAAWRIVQWQGFQLWGQAHGGRITMRYEPDQLLFTAPGGGEAIAVDFAPVNEWTGGLAASVRREFFSNLALAAQLTHSSFALDTSHRSGDEIIQQREGFHNWSLGLSASWLLDL
ncbi:hypothetical protein DRQ32_02315 [bacterium]|nr:MAG: hypothetical protein DRQ32_02315 [bacterium]